MSVDTEGSAEPQSIKQEASVCAYQLFTTQKSQVSGICPIKDKEQDVFTSSVCQNIGHTPKSGVTCLCLSAQFMGSLCDSIKTV